MRRLWIGLLGLPLLVAVYACGAPQPAPAKAVADTCPLVSPGPPPVCPEDCHWDGDECRVGRGIIVYTVRDGGSPPTPVPTSSATPQ